MITEYALDTVFTISFLNLALGDKTPRVWVCEDAWTYSDCLAELRKADHIQIVQSGQSLIKRRFDS